MKKSTLRLRSNHNYAVILAGGVGSRFWPLSRSLEPKQFLSLFTPLETTGQQKRSKRSPTGFRANSLFQDTLSRIKGIVPAQNIFVVTNQLYFPEIFSYTSVFKIPRPNIVFEPEGKNTAASVAIASRLIALSDPKAKMVVLPSDHWISNRRRFNRLLRFSFSLDGLKENLVIFGIPPDYPATGYGYVKVRNQKTEHRNQNIYKVERFIEKPNISSARRFFKAQRYFWNSGMFAGYAGVFVEEIKRNLPSLYRLISQVYEPGDIKKIWKDIKPISFDYGVLEGTKNLLMIPASNLGWSDLGAWASLDKILPKDKLANTINADALILGSQNITVLGKNRLIACLGLRDLIVVDTPDALLITRKDRSEEVKRVVDILKKGKREETYSHKTVKRPWGRYTLLDRAAGFKIKLVEVSPKRALSLQRHSRRSEHWVVVEGRAKVTKGRRVYYVNANESTFIPLSCVHRLENPTNSALKIVEVQSGDYLEEDDIVRIRDDFERV